jgi:hypothetical protein
MAFQFNRYAAANLEPGEKILYQTRIHWISLLGPIVISIVGFVGLTLLGDMDLAPFIESPLTATIQNPMIIGHVMSSLTILLGLFGLWIKLIRIISTELSITTRRVIWKTGLIWRTPDETKRSYIEGCRIVGQSWLGQLLHYGTIEVKSIGGSLLRLEDVVNPMKVRNEVNRPLPTRPQDNPERPPSSQ